MIIPNEILTKWQQLKVHGDVTTMAGGDETKRVYLSRAFQKGECSEEIFITLRDFYKKREELLETAK